MAKTEESIDAKTAETARLDALTAMYQSWCKEQGLPFISADDQILSTLTEEQRAIVTAFIEIWDRE